jgi:adenylate cyclase
MPSVQIHAEALDQILTGQIPIRRSWMKSAEAATTLAIGTLAIFAVIVLSPSLATAVVVALCLMLFAIGVGLSTKFLWLIDPIAPLAAVLFAAQSTALAQFGIVHRQRVAIERRFAQHLSPQAVQRIVDNPGELKLEGETRTITAVFTDIEGFTALTERLGPEAVVALLDRYIDTVADIVVAHGGMVDKIVGDAVHAYFNAPLDLPDHAVKAVECALRIVAATEKLRCEPDIQPSQLGRTRIGIETGPAVLGDVGRGTKRDYTAYGRPPNLASRLQEINKKFGSSIALGPGTVTALSGKIPLRHLGHVKLSGIDEEIEIFEPTLTIGPAN